MLSYVPRETTCAYKTKSESMSSTMGSNRQEFSESTHNEFRLKRFSSQSAYEVAKEKDRAVIKFEELRFLATKTDGLSEEDAEIIEMQKEEIRQNY
ncbi:hypothetical protein Tco_1098778 [Tanacetum coccineum]